MFIVCGFRHFTANSLMSFEIAKWTFLFDSFCGGKFLFEKNIQVAWSGLAIPIDLWAFYISLQLIGNDHVLKYEGNKLLVYFFYKFNNQACYSVVFGHGRDYPGCYRKSNGEHYEKPS